ncbi:FAD-dependent oxidoreductase [bacterium]|nr:FAD-dependent oxidoreductase [bacterium]
MNKSAWRRVAELADLQNNQPVVIKVDDHEIFLLRQDNDVVAVGNECPHHGAPLNEGFITDHELVCPWHNARFDLQHGQPISPPALDGLPVYETRVDKGAVFIRAKKEPAISKPEGPEPRVILIVGAGAAAQSAAETFRRQGFAGKIQMLTREKDLPYDRTLLSKPYLSGQKTDENMLLRSQEFYEDLEIEVMTGCMVHEIDISKRKAYAGQGESFIYTQCLLATGGIPRKPGIPGEDLNNVVTLRSWDDGRKIRSALKKVKQVLIVGAGFIGLEAAASLRDAGVRVHLVAPEKVFLAPVFGEAVGKYLLSQHESRGVRFHLGHTVKEYHGDKMGYVREAELSDGTLLPVELVIEGLGIDPAVDYLKGTGLLENGEVLVDGRLQTHHPEIFAAGDIARIPDPVTGEPHRFEHWVEAQRQGKHAALSMLGAEDNYNEVPFFWTRQYGQSLKYIGNAPQFDRTAVLGDIRKGEFLIGYYSGGRLSAAASIGMDAELFEVEKHLKRSDGLSAARLESGDLQ